jgi:SAM-dependent methyltransferase
VSLGPEYFDTVYATSPDPWSLASRWYEARKYALSVALLPRPRYRRAFEPGCSIGVLTELLASRCDSLLACDVAPTAVQAAARRTSALPHVRVARRRLPADWPGGTFDLIVLSEVLYYFSKEDLGEVLDRSIAALEDGGTLLAVHWRHPVADYPLSGDEAHRALARRPELTLVADHTEPDFLAQVYVRAPQGTDPVSLSVATHEGLA